MHAFERTTSLTGSFKHAKLTLGLALTTTIQEKKERNRITSSAA